MCHSLLRKNMWTQNSFVIVLLALSLFSVLSAGQSDTVFYYISATRGNDSNVGTIQAQPFQTVQRFIDNLSSLSGSIKLLIDGGNYSVFYNSPSSRATILTFSLWSEGSVTFTDFNFSIGGTSSIVLIFEDISFTNNVFITTGRESTVNIKQCLISSSVVSVYASTVIISNSAISNSRVTVSVSNGGQNSPESYMSVTGSKFYSSRDITFRELSTLDIKSTNFSDNTGEKAGALTLIYTVPQNSTFQNVNFVNNGVVNNATPAISITYPDTPDFFVRFNNVYFNCNYRLVSAERTFPPPVSGLNQQNIEVISVRTGQCKINCSNGAIASENDLYSCAPVQVISCTAGQYSRNGVCTPCPPGTYKNLNGSGSCIVCEPPTFQPNASSTGCVPCGPGSYYINSTVCGLCPRGTYEQDGVCRRCPYKLFKNSRTGETDCDRWQATGIVIVIAIVLGFLSILCLIITLLLSRGLRLDRKERNYSQMKDRKAEERTNREA
eukprot:TRINITY_DN8003_c0_g1_i2.p1 TRINITY_DN8003_c0_g1~~TRINITY_DN8003_c0_g1_i2.p1  ORF type:complete len:495 (-),score=35.22 TRINITY_DN8003_c0_g1_i2:13-1497(-)